MRTLEGKMVADSIKIGIVVARFNEFITSKLLGGAMDGLVRHGMDEDDVEKLAFMALNAGKNIEMYLDYMDEDAIKRLLLQSVRR